MGTVTVNGKPQREWEAEQLAVEIAEVRESENSFKRLPLGSSKFRFNVSKAKSGKGKVVYVDGQKESHALIAGSMFDWRLKAPYVRSGSSILGGIEYCSNTDEVKCHECGEWRNDLSRHVRCHDSMTMREYKTKHGLRLTSSTATPRIRRKYESIGKDKASRGIGTLIYGKPDSVKEHSCTIKRRSAAIRASRGLGFSCAPETANLRGKCKAQLSEQLLSLCGLLKRTPTDRDMKENGIDRKTVEKVFGVKLKGVFVSLGINPRPSGGSGRWMAAREIGIA